ncbi:dynamin family protein [Micromonospora sp. NPDC048898]|uniref:dynamin family protein n=1 Tax=Micromonospora sp. NPDC048898 TaxID=3364260 RepID=UPI003714E04F
MPQWAHDAALLAAEVSAALPTPHPARAQLDRMLDEWAQDTPRVAVIGASSAGKTTLLRTLFDADNLPTGRAATTAAITVLRHGTPARGELHHDNRKPPAQFDFADPTQARDFRTALVNPAAATQVTQAVCYLPHPRLRGLTVIDTAGFSSPVAFHTEISAALLARRPDVVVLLLDARRLDSPPAHDALAALRTIVRSPDDYDRLIVGLTHTERAIRSMAHDLDLDPTEAEDLTAVLVARLQETAAADLTVMLAEHLGWRPAQPPTTVALALGEKAPAELRGNTVQLWDLVRRLTDTGISSATWRGRASAVASLVKALAEACTRQRAADAAEIEQLTDHLHAGRQRLTADEVRLRTVATTVGRSIDRIRDCVLAERAALVVHINGLPNDKAVKGFLSAGYAQELAGAITRIRTVAEEQHDQVHAVITVTGLMSPVVLDERFLTADTGVAHTTTRLLSGVRHRFRQGWGLALGSVADLAGRDLARARAMLAEHAHHQVSHVGRHLELWVAHLLRIQAQELSATRAQDEYIRTQLASTEERIAALTRRIDVHGALARRAEGLCRVAGSVGTPNRVSGHLSDQAAFHPAPDAFGGVEVRGVGG